MDKSWVGLDNRISHEFMTVLDKFLDFAFSKRPLGAKDIYCPCRDCSNRYLNDRATVKLHCIEVGFQRDYKNWIRHGEEYVSAHDHINNCRTNDEAIEIDLGVQDCMRQMVHEAMGMPNNNPSMPSSNLPGIEEIVQSDAATAKFLKLLKDADQALWEGCTEYTKLSFIVELMHWKASSRLADKGFTSLLKIFIRALPKSAKVPNSYREAYKMTADLGFSYKTWDACINHCMLFRNETEKLIKCEICGAARYKQHDDGGSDEGGKTSGKSSLGKKIAMKKVWYFPLKLRLQRWYFPSTLAKQWREWKHRVKKIYNDYETDEERLANLPQRVVSEQWAHLVHEWGSEESKQISEINKLNRSKQECLHRTGKKSHSTVIKELEDEGKLTDRLSVYIATRTDKSGQPVDLTTSRMILTLTDAVEELPEEDQSSPSKREKIFTNIVGKDGHGRLRCMGQGLTKSMVFGKASTSETTSRVRELEEKLESQRTEFASRFEAQAKAFEEFKRTVMLQLQGKGDMTFQPMEENDSKNQ